jgi:hypothetical protein
MHRPDVGRNILCVWRGGLSTSFFSGVEKVSRAAAAARQGPPGGQAVNLHPFPLATTMASTPSSRSSRAPPWPAAELRQRPLCSPGRAGTPGPCARPFTTASPSVGSPRRGLRRQRNHVVVGRPPGATSTAAHVSYSGLLLRRRSRQGAARTGIRDPS